MRNPCRAAGGRGGGRNAMPGIFVTPRGDIKLSVVRVWRIAGCWGGVLLHERLAEGTIF